MRRIMGLVLAGVMLALGTVTATAQEPAGKEIRIVPAADVDTELLERVRLFVENNLHIATAVAPATEFEASDPAAIAAAAAEMVSGDVLAAVVLVGPTAAGTELLTRPETGVAVVNLAMLKSGQPDKEPYERRIERLVLRSIGVLMGMDECPNPRCALHDYKGSFEILDAMGRNFCPPCMSRTQDAGKNKGARMVERARMVPGK